MKAFWSIFVLIVIVSCSQKEDTPAPRTIPQEAESSPQKIEAEPEETREIESDAHWYDNTDDVVAIMDTIPWSTVQEKDLFESTEGGVARYFSNGDTMMLIATVHYGEMGQLRTKYYTVHGKLLFVREHKVEYSRPIYYTPDMLDEGEEEIPNDSTITQIKNYFQQGNLIQQFRNKEKTISEDRLQSESRRIHESYDLLIEKLFGKK